MRPMLAGKFDEQMQKFPALASPKLDGIRAIVQHDVVHSRSWKHIPNRHVQQLFGRPEYERMDGELIVGSPTHKNCMQITTSGIMSYAGEPNVTFWVFDQLPHGRESYQMRLDALEERFQTTSLPHCKPVPQTWVTSLEQLYELEQSYLVAGFEGMIIRSPLAEYKQGRGTTRAGDMLKLKRFTDAEAVIIGFIELEHNSNEAQFDERGYTKRSHAQEGKIPAGRLGVLVCRDLATGEEVKLGTGFTEQQRKGFWEEQHRLLGLLVKYKHFAYGRKDKQRQPVFLGFRHPIDL